MTGSPAFRLERCGSSQGRGAVFVGEDALPAETEYEKLRAKYREEDVRGIPMSVREHYETALGELRARLRQHAHARRLGEILLGMNVIDRNTLTRALAEQLAEGGGALLGEILVRREWADLDPIRRGVARQAAELS